MTHAERAKEAWERTPPERRFGNPDLIRAVRLDEDQQRRQKLIDLCEDCGPSGEREQECEDCGGDGVVWGLCEHENVPEGAEVEALAAEAAEKAAPPLLGSTTPPAI